MALGNNVFQLQEGAGWSRGLNNLLSAELNRWFGTRMWWVQILIWAAIINGILFMVAVTTEAVIGDELLTIFNVFLGTFAAVGVCIIMQGVIVGEKQTGTAAWVLSKPVSRIAFVFAKLIGNTIGITVTIVLAQGLIAYLIITLASDMSLSPIAYLGGLAVQLVNLLFYITLTLMLGAIFSRRGAVIAIPLVFLFSQQFLIGLVPALVNVLPWTLTMPPDNGAYSSVAMSVMTGAEPLTYLPILTTLSTSLWFLAIGLGAFARQEF